MYNFSFLENFDIKQGVDYIWKEIGELDKFIQETEPFKVVKKEKIMLTNRCLPVKYSSPNFNKATNANLVRF